MNDKILKIITDEYDAAVKKHPWFAGGRMHAVSLIIEELGELAREFNDEKHDYKHECNARAMIEAAHVAVTAIRLMEMLEEYVKMERRQKNG